MVHDRCKQGPAGLVNPGWACRGVLEEMEAVLTKARMFAHKPDGEVTWMALRDAQGNPAPVMQDPMHFPHGTGFLAPGRPLLCSALPALFP